MGVVQRENVERLMGWLADGSPERLANPAAEALVRRLADLVFQGDADWPNNGDLVDAYGDALSAWFTQEGDGGPEARFVALTGPGADADVLIDWFLPELVERAGRGERLAPGGERQARDGESEAGYANTGFDGTPGTEFYRVDESGQYLYSASAQGGDWAPYEQRRYSEPTPNENYGLDCRFDHRDGTYQWYDAVAGTWNDQAWADALVASGHGSTAQAPVSSAQPEWDKNWAMFYRVGADGVYEFADAVAPGVESSGCGDAWLSQEQVLARRQPREPAAVREATAAGTLESLQAEVRTTVENVLAKMPQLREGLTQKDIEAVIAELSKNAIDG